MTLANVNKKAQVVAEADVAVGDAPRTWDFAQDIAPILTRSGCNTGGLPRPEGWPEWVHLSLFGYDPKVTIGA